MAFDRDRTAGSTKRCRQTLKDLAQPTPVREIWTLRRSVFQGLYRPGGTQPSGQSLITMTYAFARIVFASALGALVTGCATVPGDPYYEPPRYQVYEQPGYIYSAPPPVYRTPGVIYSAPPPPPAVYYGGRDRHDDRWDNDRGRNNWRDRDRDRAERERAARDRDHREHQARDADRWARERDQSRREQAERDRRAADDWRNRDPRSGRQAPDSHRPHPQDWRSRQQPNSFDKP